MFGCHLYLISKVIRAQWGCSLTFNGAHLGCGTERQPAAPVFQSRLRDLCRQNLHSNLNNRQVPTFKVKYRGRTRGLRSARNPATYCTVPSKWDRRMRTEPFGPISVKRERRESVFGADERRGRQETDELKRRHRETLRVSGQTEENMSVTLLESDEFLLLDRSRSTCNGKGCCDSHTETNPDNYSKEHFSASPSFTSCIRS